jgi:hypothetical protein
MIWWKVKLSCRIWAGPGVSSSFLQPVISCCAASFVEHPITCQYSYRSQEQHDHNCATARLVLGR